MQHMVVYGTVEGKPSYLQADDLEGAVRFVEHLVNVENVTDSRIYQLHEVPIEFKTYYRVQVAPAAGLPAEPPVPESVAEVAVEAPVDDSERMEEAAVPAAAARFGLFSRS